MNNETNPARIVAINPSTGCHLRAATPAECAAFNAQPIAYRNAIRVGDVLIDDTSDPSIVDNQSGHMIAYV